jgi:hypothetical protein
MRHDVILSPAFVIKAEELPAVNYLSPDHPRPWFLEWIDRGTDQKLKRSTVDMLLRTLFQEEVSASIVRLHQSAGLRLHFRTDRERHQFAAAFTAARADERVTRRHVVTALFDDREHAERAVKDLKAAGVAPGAISLLWRTSQFLQPESEDGEGHSKFSVAAAVAGGGIAGAVLGIVLLSVPGIGPIAAAGAIAASAYSSVGAVSAAFGATGGAIARMLTDHDVDGREAIHCAKQIGRGKVFLAVATRIAKGKLELARRILTRNGGRGSFGVERAARTHEAAANER